MSIDAELFKRGPGVIREKVLLPEYGKGEYVWVHTLTAMEYRRLLASVRSTDDDGTGIDSLLAIAECCRNDAGEKMLTAADIDRLKELPSPVVERIVDAIWRLNRPDSVGKLEKKSDAATQGET